MVIAAAEQGDWVLFQNIHLLNPIKNKLEKILNLIKSPHSDFRLWITTEPIEKLPIEILQNFFKGKIKSLNETILSLTNK